MPLITYTASSPNNPHRPCPAGPRAGECPCGAFAGLLRGDGGRAGTGAEAKGRLPHGAFGAWCEGELDGLSAETARRFIRVAEVFKSVKLTDLNISATALYALASGDVPESVRDEFVGRVEAGERVTHAMAKPAP